LTHSSLWEEKPNHPLHHQSPFHLPPPYSPHVPFNFYLYFQFPPSAMPQDISLSPPFLHLLNKQTNTYIIFKINKLIIIILSPLPINAASFLYD